MPLQTVRDVASLDVVTARPDTSARALAEQMRDQEVGSVVIQGSGHPIGIVIDRDLTVEVLAEGADGTESYARELMTEYPVTVGDDHGVAEAARTMGEYGVRRMPVVDGGDVLVAIVTVDDVYRELVAEHAHLADVVAAESPD